MKYYMDGQKRKALSDAKARELGPTIDDLRATGMPVKDLVAEINARGFRSIEGALITPSVYQRIRARWAKLQRQGEALKVT